MASALADIAIWNLYYDTYNTEPKNATELINFSQLSYNKANAIFQQNKGKGKIEINNNPTSFTSPRASEQIHNIIVSNCSITPQEMKNRKHNAPEHFDDLISRSLNEKQILSDENNWIMLLDSIFENSEFDNKLKLLNKLKTIAEKSMDKDDTFRNINLQNKNTTNVLKSNKGCMEYLKGLGFHHDSVNNKLKMPTPNHLIINTAIRATQLKIELIKLYIELNELWQKCMLLMQQNLIYINQCNVLKQVDFMNNYDDYYFILDEFTSISDMKLQSNNLVILQIMSALGFDMSHASETNDLNSQIFDCIGDIYVHVYNIENYKKENYLSNICMTRIETDQKEMNEEQGYHYCICGDILHEQKIINEEIICDGCLNVIETNNTMYYCDRFTDLHKGGFDMCWCCINKQNTNRVELNHIQDQIQSFKNAFDAVSVNGVITKDRIRHLEQFRDLSDDEIDQCFCNIDTDNNGVIDFQEFYAFLKPFMLDIHDDVNEQKYHSDTVPVHTPTLSNLCYSNYSRELNMDLEMLIFTMFDDDGNGIVDGDELNTMLCTLGEDKYQYTNTTDLIQQFDKGNKNGINKEEFTQLLRFLKAKTPVDIVATFNKISSNNIFSDEKETKQEQQSPGSYDTVKPLEFHGWRTAYTRDGKLYYQNDISKQTSWSMPEICQWREAYTPHGKLYYQNDVTKQTQWQQPIAAEIISYKRNINYFDQWTVNDLTEWISDLNINEQNKRKLIWGIVEMQLTGNDFISCQNAADIIHTFEGYGINEYVAKFIWNNELLDIFMKIEWKNKHINEWTCNQLQGWILNLNLNDEIEQLLLSEIIMYNIDGEAFNAMKSPKDIIESFPDCGLNYNIGNSIYNCLIKIREEDYNYEKTQPVYREPVAEFSKISRFEDEFVNNKYYGKSGKLNIAMTLCMKKLVYDLQCYIAKEINHKDASKFDRMVGIYDSKNKFSKVIDKLKKKLNWNNKLFKLFRSIAKLGLTISINFALPGGSCIFHFFEAAKHFYNGNTKKAFWQCALGVATIVTVGFLDEIMDISQVLLNVIDDLDIIQSAVSKLRGIIKGIARLLKPLLKGYIQHIKPFVDKICSKLIRIGIPFQPNQIIVRKLCKFKLVVDELIQQNGGNQLDEFLEDKVNEMAAEQVDDIIKNKFGGFKNINEAKNHFIDELQEEIRDRTIQFCWDEIKQICKNKGIKLKVPFFGNKNIIKNNNERDNNYEEKPLSEEDIAMDKQRMIDEIGYFVKDISKYYKNTQISNNNLKSEAKLFNQNCDTMIYVSIKQNLNQIETDKRKQYEYKATVQCIVMMAGNNEAKTQFLVQKLVEENDKQTPGSI